MSEFPKTLPGFYWTMLKKFKVFALCVCTLGIGLSAWGMILLTWVVLYSGKFAKRRAEYRTVYQTMRT